MSSSDVCTRLCFRTVLLRIMQGEFVLSGDHSSGELAYLVVFLFKHFQTLCRSVLSRGSSSGQAATSILPFAFVEGGIVLFLKI